MAAEEVFNGPVLIPLDGSEVAASMVPRAAALARALGLPVVLLQVVDPHTVQVPEGRIGSAPPDALGVGGRRGFSFAQNQLIDQELDKARAQLETVAAELRATGLQAAVRTHEGQVGPTILATAQEEGASLIAMSTHGRTGLQRLMMGSVTDYVVHHTTLPVLVARPAAAAPGTAPWRRLLLPLDGSDEGAAVSVPLAVRVARALGVPLNVVRVVPVPRVAATGVPGDMSGAVELVAYAADDAMAVARRYLDTVGNLLEAAGVPGERIVCMGVPEDEIVALAEPDTLLVMATRGRTGLARMVLGSVADRVMRTANAAVLLVPRHR